MKESNIVADWALTLNPWLSEMYRNKSYVVCSPICMFLLAILSLNLKLLRQQWNNHLYWVCSITAACDNGCWNPKSIAFSPCSSFKMKLLMFCVPLPHLHFLFLLLQTLADAFFLKSFTSFQNSLLYPSILCKKAKHYDELLLCVISSKTHRCLIFRKWNTWRCYNKPQQNPSQLPHASLKKFKMEGSRCKTSSVNPCQM